MISPRTTQHQAASRTNHGEEERSSRRSFFFFGALAAAALIPKTASARRDVRVSANAIRHSRASEQFRKFRRTKCVGGVRGVGSPRSRGSFVASPSASRRRKLPGRRSMGWQGYLNYQLNYSAHQRRRGRSHDRAEVAVDVARSSDALFSADAGPGAGAAARVDALSRARSRSDSSTSAWSSSGPTISTRTIDKVGYLLVADQRDVIRKHALGKFPRLCSRRARTARR